jgi:hypothetical protein
MITNIRPETPGGVAATVTSAPAIMSAPPQTAAISGSSSVETVLDSPPADS